MFQGVSFTRKWLSIGWLCFALLLITSFLTPGQADVASARPHSTQENDYTVCTPTQTNRGAAFPYYSTLSSISAPSPCGKTFSWGYTTSGGATGQAEWDGHSFGATVACQAQAFIPDNHAGAPGAQYFLYDGSHYLANFTVNQEYATGWVDLYSQDFTISNFMRVTLSDHDDTGAGGWDIAAYAVRFICLL